MGRMKEIRETEWRIVGALAHHSTAYCSPQLLSSSLGPDAAFSKGEEVTEKERELETSPGDATDMIF